MYLVLTGTCQKDLDHYAVNTANTEQKQIHWIFWRYPINQITIQIFVHFQKIRAPGFKLA